MSSPAVESSEDVNDFLLRIKELGDKRDQEDEERNRKLEEEILQGRKERQARRAEYPERARSISPTKSSPATTPTTPESSLAQQSALSQSIDAAEVSEARRETVLDDSLERSPTNENTSLVNSERDTADAGGRRDETAKMPPSTVMPPARNSPLSWQQRRPNSQASERPRSRTLSMVATENAARSPKATPEPTSASVEPTLSRDKIAQSLATKDPAWFRQTADRGLNSPAYRRNQVEDEERSDHGQSSARVQMPGMSRAPSEPEQSVEEPVDRSSSLSRGSAGYGSPSSYQALPRVAGGMGSPVPLTNAQRFDPPVSESRIEPRGLAMSPSQGRISPERRDRPTSPTKGMGGFVQSAMMKRSDSVSKRWSVQSPPGLKRGNSVTSNKSNQDTGKASFGGMLHTSVESSRPGSGSLTHEASPQSSSRPTSSHSNATITQDRPSTASSMRSNMTASTTNDGFVKPTLPASRSQTPQGLAINPEESSTETLRARAYTSSPVSPSKTMDPRRWSPTKSSWLESALNKPESPKPKAVPPSQQLVWMSGIHKAKQQTSIDLGRSPNIPPKHEVNIGGLMRSPPPGGPAKPQSIGGLPAGFSSGAASKSRADSMSSQDAKYSLKRTDSGGLSGSNAISKDSSPASGKVKPETPPKKDFRASLKPRQPPAVNDGKGEPEFKNVFGQLRSTKTKNYVAPDVLKSNISRGKAALNVTGGPKKTERVDEFKEAILKKKDDFKKTQADGKSVAVARPRSFTTQDAPVPEALARRKTLGKADAVTIDTGFNVSDSPERRTERELPKPSLPTKETSAPSGLQGKEAMGGKLAGRFNPALAGVLARGPPSMASDTSRSSSPSLSQRTASQSTSMTNPEVPDSGPQLTHMTKGRARGPRRKAPSSAPNANITPSENVSGGQEELVVNTKAPGKPTSVAGLTKLSTPEATQSSTAKRDTEKPVSEPSSPRKLDVKRRSQFLQEVPDRNNKAGPQLESPRPRPLSLIKKANMVEIPVSAPDSNLDSSPSTKTKPLAPPKSPATASKAWERMGRTSEAPSPDVSPLALRYSKTVLEPENPKATENSPASPTSGDEPKPAAKRPRPLSAKSVKNITAQWDSPTESKSRQESPRARSPIKLPTHADEKANMVAAGLRSASPEKEKTPIGLGIQRKVSPTTRPLPTPPSKSIESPPPSASLQTATSPMTHDSLVPQASEASTMLADFFGQRKVPAPNFTADTAAILAARPDQGTNIKTVRSALYQLSADGKKQLVPSHQERILFEGNFYLCTHTFGNAAGKRVTEVYYWVGDEVPYSVAVDAEIFAEREARSSGGKLHTIRQGREPPEFFQSLGGIIIIRRGTSNKYDSLAPHILCGRKHFGQIAFDEVDFSAQSLCSGFPYLISTQSGKSYLWKGKGSGIDELSCARLIGMDFGLTGDIEEVEDGSEPASFLEIFDGDIPKSADHWRMKPNYNKYCSRLFSAESSAKDQIVEMSPFCQADLSTTKIYVLDTFFEIYILVGARAQSQYLEFQNALMFAQEYGILAAGMEDRPFVPVSNVILEGVPRDLKSVFRKWKDELSPTMQKQSTGLQRVRSLRVVPLNAAIEATR
ncbi:Advillin [Lachnellula occidentalis]|uniref:Advillin n=1 Tax=Lachnellula occidentalis TaxID=215460 RepID=A0A8H8S4D0_9HELO|nr:Advillin [Lachnellula occidentalis]